MRRSLADPLLCVHHQSCVHLHPADIRLVVVWPQIPVMVNGLADSGSIMCLHDTTR